MTQDCPLRPRQLETVKLLSLGKTANEAAALMGVTRNTIITYLQKAFDETGTSNTTGLVAMSLRRGWIQ